MPGISWPSGAVSVCLNEAPLCSVSVVGEVMESDTHGDHVDPSPHELLLESQHSAVGSPCVSVCQGVYCDNDYSEQSVDDHHSDYVDAIDYESHREPETFPTKHGFTQRYTDFEPGKVLFSTTSPDGRDISVFTECVQGRCDCINLIGGIASQLKPCRFASLIYLDLEGREEEFEDLLWHITDGFPIVDTDVPPYECKNYESITAPENAKKMNVIIAKELAEGIISFSECKPHCVHSLGAVPKAGGGIRPITDCSRPLGKSVNNFCENLINDFCFKSVDNVVEMLSSNEFMTVVDIKSAYRAVPIKEEHRKFQGFSWPVDGEPRWFVDNRLCFGLRLGPSYFNTISNFVHEILSKKFGLRIVNYLDDFIAIGSDFAQCLEAQNDIVETLRYLGFHVSYDKLIGPSRSVVYLGIVIDSERMELRLPEGKLAKLISMLDKYLYAKCISKKELECLGGLLSHCAHIVKGGKIFSKSVYALYKKIVNSNSKHIIIPEIVKADLSWWRKLCKYFNGSKKVCKTVFPHAMVSDSSFKGFGVYLGSDWAAGVWDDSDSIPLVTPCNHICFRPVYDLSAYNNINELEMWPIVVGLKRWAPSFKDQTVYVFTDNTQVMYMLINGGSTNEVCKRWIKEIFWICAIYNIDLLPRYINTKSNLVADTLSRIPYLKDANQLIECLLGSDLCCLNTLFENFQARKLTS